MFAVKLFLIIYILFLTNWIVMKEQFVEFQARIPRLDMIMGLA